MYSEVTISDNSWLITLGYEVCSVAILVFFVFLRFRHEIIFRYHNLFTIIVVMIFSFIQYQIIKFGADDIYRFFGYAAWDDSSIRYSAMFFFVAYIIFVVDFKSLKR
ncbi:hypothetical protein EPYR_00668 [Erwinia pyrifoliae DSM 12163]|nr:conserved uncharacterized protein [Erwinia pyrifoliae Ep1/96]CAY73032.1 hypothetical protein EPYR_00668 [Erwinia pyrifoliae DSM 12163]